MRNRYKGKCGLCGIELLPKQGRWKMIPTQTQCFIGLRCLSCGTTTKKGLKLLKSKGLIY